jgi:hypothetical protein
VNAALPLRAASRFAAFELSALRRLEFASIAIPFAGSPNLAWYLKIWKKQVFANDLAQSAWWSLRALVENGSERLDDDDIDRIARVALDPPRALTNPGLLGWLSETDASWFDELRTRVDGIESPLRRALAIRAGLLTAGYALSFTRETWLLRRPLGDVFAEMARSDRPPVDNGLQNVVANMEAEAFVMQVKADLVYLRLPGPEGFPAWRAQPNGLYEVWARGADAFWDEWEVSQHGRLGSSFHSKRAYLTAVDRLLDAVTSFPMLVLIWQDSSWVTAGELAEAISRHRRIRVVYSKDFSEVPSGRKTSAIVADA